MYFLAGSYPAAHRDSLVELAHRARDHALALLGVERFDRPIDVFFIESRAQMDSLVGAPLTGFAHRDARAVFLMTNEEWRSFERHEIMHVIAHQVWEPPAEPSAWIVEGLAQFADGRCGRYSVDSVARSLIESEGTVPLDTLTRRFRQLDDLTAYLQAASMVGYIYNVHGRDAIRRTWQEGLGGFSANTGVTADELMDAWRRWLEDTAPPIPENSIASIRRKGCGWEITGETGWRYLGIDTSPAPGLDSSIGRVIETLAGAPFGSPSTLSACSTITSAIQGLDAKTCGYSGLMLPVLEDRVLAERAVEDRYGVSDLLLYSSVCGTGLDVVPIPGDVPVGVLADAIGDVAALAARYRKPLSARLLPVPGKSVGDAVDFDNPFLTRSVVMALG